jgi:hypothetical protein
MIVPVWIIVHGVIKVRAIFRCGHVRMGANKYLCGDRSAKSNK